MSIQSRTLFAATLLASTSGTALLLAPQLARADDCLLDTNNDGNADSNVDTDLAAEFGRRG